jgi:hypothetical protein
MALILQKYTVKNPIFVFLTSLTDFSDHLLSASASCYFSNLFWLYIFIYILWGPKNRLQQHSAPILTIGVILICKTAAELVNENW